MQITIAFARPLVDRRGMSVTCVLRRRFETKIGAPLRRRHGSARTARSGTACGVRRRPVQEANP